jgi:hypothetical protein
MGGRLLSDEAQLLGLRLGFSCAGCFLFSSLFSPWFSPCARRCGPGGRFFFQREPFARLCFAPCIAIFRCVRLSFAIVSCLLAAGCATMSEDMRRTEAAFSEARYEEVRVWLDELLPSVPDMSRRLRTEYYYMAGVTAARLGDSSRARHFLALCREETGPEGFALSAERLRNLQLTLAELGAD